MTDMFLDALTAAPSKVARPIPPTQGYMGAGSPALDASRIGRLPTQATPKPVQATPVAPNAGAGPDYADAIDAMVQALETAGDIVFDQEAQAYRRPHCRRFRFTMGE